MGVTQGFRETRMQAHGRTPQLHIRLCTLALLAVVGMFGGVGGVEGQSSGDEYVQDDGPVRKVVRSLSMRSSRQVGRYGSQGALGRMFSFSPLPGEQGASDGASNPDELFEDRRIPDYGKINRENVNLVLPPLKGFQQLSDSELLKDMFKELTQKQVPVLFQTFMMVENGAGTGYIGGLNAVSNLFANTMQASDFQLKLLESTDDTGKMKEAYIKKIAKAFDDNKNDIWPQALYAAVGDSGKLQGGGMKNITSNGEAKPYDLTELPRDQAGGAGGAAEGKERWLSNLLFVKKDSQNAQAGQSPNKSDQRNEIEVRNEQIDKLKKNFVKLVGDVQILLDSKQQSPSLRRLQINYVAPGVDSKQRRGVAAENYEEVKVVWESIHKILYGYCEFMKKNENAKKKPNEKKTAFLAEDVGKDDSFGNPWELASSPDISLSFNLVEQIFQRFQNTSDPSKFECNSLQLSGDDIPQDRDLKGGGESLNDCSQSKGCERSRLILFISYVLARSKTLHAYRTLYVIAKRFATDEMLSHLLDQLFVRALAGMDVDEELERNRRRWEAFAQEMAELSQGNAGSGAYLKPHSPLNSMAFRE